MPNIDTVPITVEATQQKKTLRLPIVILCAGKIMVSRRFREFSLNLLFLLHNVHYIAHSQSKDVARCSHVRLHVHVRKIPVGVQIGHFAETEN